ncbi:pyruvate carboxyltransferase [Rhodococcus sp. G-MC3]|uniref:pyruvate carboxyltransferase n=1 Tax=Rhodococcus sp. G-MC3 TaxID=3046209 RepID=UPI0024B93B1A|nr:pyruvate carboxyltransferase [Rhodococcus sp. G-MC3]MDJ0396570.1 pyruvate carboxyltransferase [Rhodococcus sp. G-MC3]
MTDVRIRDISPRLTFQAQPAATSDKVELVNRLIAAGVSAVEVSSFVRPDLVPGLADAAEVFAKVDRPPGISLECCVGNGTGVKQAIDAGAHVAWFLLSVDAGFSAANSGRGIEDSLAVLERLRSIAADSELRLGTYLIGTWGGPTGLPRRPSELEPILSRLAGIGVTDWILADSFGYAAPPQIRDIVTYAAGFTGYEHLTVQVHDSRGMGIANVAELARMGVRNIDTSLLGAGGHPAVPGAQVGGVCTEDAVQLLELMDVDTGIDLVELIDTANWFADISGHDRGFTHHVGAVPRVAGDPRPERGEFAWPTASNSQTS